MDIIKHLKNMFIKPSIYDMGLYLKIKGLPFTELELSGSQCFIQQAAHGSHYWQLSAGAAHTAALCAAWVTPCKLQLQAEFLHPAVTTYFVPDYLLSFWVGRIREYN